MVQTMEPDSVFGQVVKLRREFHRHPEFSYQEVETAQRVIAELDRLGIPHEHGGKDSGVVGALSRGGAGPVVALRAEMDALPCAEKTNLPFASEEPDARHACGHDAHMAMALGAAALLKQSPPPGRVLRVSEDSRRAGERN